MSAVAVNERADSARGILRTYRREVDSSVCRVYRRRPSRFIHKLKRVLIAIAVLVALAYIAVYAGVTALGYHNCKLSKLCRQQLIENERLRVAITRCSSPQQIAAAAEKAGMICATAYEYLRAPQSLASAR
ncbi:MAG: hypothetical protein QHI38_12625 [Armatimonadota bacterium]|nr:hypothetical protein [Armatimonadota bacterium]